MIVLLLLILQANKFDLKNAASKSDYQVIQYLKNIKKDLLTVKISGFILIVKALKMLLIILIMKLISVIIMKKSLEILFVN